MLRFFLNSYHHICIAAWLCNSMYLYSHCLKCENVSYNKSNAQLESIAYDLDYVNCMYLLIQLIIFVQSFLMNATTQLFGSCDSSGAQKSAATTPLAIVPPSHTEESVKTLNQNCSPSRGLTTPNGAMTNKVKIKSPIFL